jgi:hypothetical protein
MPARPADKGLRYEVPDRKGMWITVVRKCVEFITLLPVLDPNLLVTHRANKHQTHVEMDVVCLQFGRICGIAGKIVIVIAYHHRDLDARSGGAELIEDGLVRRNYVIEFSDSPRDGQFPESERIAED